MTRAALRREIKKAIDQLPDNRLDSVADYVAYLSRPTLKDRIDQAERDITAGRFVNWRRVRDDV